MDKVEVSSELLAAVCHFLVPADAVGLEQVSSKARASAARCGLWTAAGAMGKLVRRILDDEFLGTGRDAEDARSIFGLMPARVESKLEKYMFSSIRLFNMSDYNAFQGSVARICKGLQKEHASYLSDKVLNSLTCMMNPQVARNEWYLGTAKPGFGERDAGAVRMMYSSLVRGLLPHAGCKGVLSFCKELAEMRQGRQLLCVSPGQLNEDWKAEIEVALRAFMILHRAADAEACGTNIKNRSTDDSPDHTDSSEHHHDEDSDDAMDDDGDDDGSHGAGDEEEEDEEAEEDGVNGVTASQQGLGGSSDVERQSRHAQGLQRTSVSHLMAGRGSAPHLQDESNTPPSPVMGKGSTATDEEEELEAVRRSLDDAVQQEQAHLQEALLRSKVDMDDMDDVVVSRLTTISNPSLIKDALMVPWLDRVLKSGGEVSPDWANGATLLVSLTRENIPEDSHALCPFHIVHVRKDRDLIQQALRSIPRHSRPKIREEREAKIHRRDNISDVASPSSNMASEAAQSEACIDFEITVERTFISVRSLNGASDMSATQARTAP
eukprot:TRINITY_DN75526_c0_g1_i1.p1 TRINITY_DN75526_c0_g1~~TRINITY_DN75526_c0_g1_i1.p1  ORF type:complete len:551 (-),score=110.82 TRINITY_DN75526_c0_g1_i1:312-1964(-)